MIFFTAVVATLAVISSFALKRIVTKKIQLNTSFIKNISVGNYVDVVLVQDPSIKSITVSGDDEGVKNLAIHFENNNLKIVSDRTAEDAPLTIRISVNDLSMITLPKGSTLSSPSLLKMHDFTVVVNEDTHVALLTWENFISHQELKRFYVQEKQKDHYAFLITLIIFFEN